MDGERSLGICRVLVISAVVITVASALAPSSGSGMTSPSTAFGTVLDSNNTVVTTINVGGHPHGLAYDSGRGEVFVANGASNNVSVIPDASNTVVSSVKVGITPAGVAYDGGKGCRAPL